MNEWRAYVIVTLRVRTARTRHRLYPGDTIGRLPASQVHIDQPEIAGTHVVVRLSDDGEMYLVRRGENVPWSRRRKLQEGGLTALLPGSDGPFLEVERLHLPEALLALRIAGEEEVLGYLNDHEYYTLLVDEKGSLALVPGYREGAATIKHASGRQPEIQPRQGRAVRLEPGVRMAVGDVEVEAVLVPRAQAGVPPTAPFARSRAAPDWPPPTAPTDPSPFGFSVTKDGTLEVVARSPKGTKVINGQPASLLQLLLRTEGPIPIAEAARQLSLSWDQACQIRNNLHRKLRELGMNEYVVWRCNAAGESAGGGKNLCASPRLRRLFETARARQPELGGPSDG